MDLARIPRRHYTAGHTPIEFLANLSRELGGPRIHIKRDDLLGLTAGGNKTRKLEFLMADAINSGADTIVTTGAVQSNHCRLTLSAAVREGMSCYLVLEERVPGSYHEEALGNHFLFRLLGVDGTEVVSAGTDLQGAMEQMAEDLRGWGRQPYIIPGGGSNDLGALGYAACAAEIQAQSFDAGTSFDHIVCASGSGGTHAGLLAGQQALSSRIPVTGISVRADKAGQEAKIRNLANAALGRLGLDPVVTDAAVQVVDDYVGPGYSLPTDEMTAAIQLFARSEGILLDPVYTGKAAAGLIGLIRQGRFASDDDVLFLHTGGAPALYAYPDAALKDVDA
ncbi:D-cysteine desulfhydrase [Pseudactinotalea sp. Z1748]|uniref:D-cysteine desulfhydrase n=1 Tax=Pseudactinotalea sp. Z1748 TaxID=3413027 RepID=UPI003C7A6326